MKITFAALFGFIFTFSAHAVIKENVKFRTYFGSCPSRSTGKLTLSLLKKFEKTSSLRDVKREIVENKLDEQYYISDYKIRYNPATSLLTFHYECPAPLLQVNVYRENGETLNSAVLVDNGELFDKEYLKVLRREKRIEGILPFLALSEKQVKDNILIEVKDLLRNLKTGFRSKLSELIIGDDGAMTIVFSEKGKPISVFMGEIDWEEKAKKLQKIVDYMGSKGKLPVIINLTNSKKVVVKFSTKS